MVLNWGHKQLRVMVQILTLFLIAHTASSQGKGENELSALLIVQLSISNYFCYVQQSQEKMLPIKV
jgi:hypothetical protein